MTRLFRSVRARLVIGVMLAAVTVYTQPAMATDAVTVNLDQATLLKLPEKVATLVVGNPLIADVAIQAGGTLVVTGKGYGSTNLIALDRAGQVLLERDIRVDGPRDQTVTVFRGMTRETYSCAPNCQRRITLGDTPEFFNATLGQVGLRNNQAQGMQGAPAR